MFTTATVLTHAFSSRKKNIEIDQSLMNNEALAVVGGVSAEGGMEAYLVQKGAINSASFIDFLRILKEKNPLTNLAVFMDNASFHRSKLVTAHL
jgi:hypothetical protein